MPNTFETRTLTLNSYLIMLELLQGSRNLFPNLNQVVTPFFTLTSSNGIHLISCVGWIFIELHPTRTYQEPAITWGTHSPIHTFKPKYQTHQSLDCTTMPPHHHPFEITTPKFQTTLVFHKCPITPP